MAPNSARESASTAACAGDFLLKLHELDFQLRIVHEDQRLPGGYGRPGSCCIREVDNLGFER